MPAKRIHDDLSTTLVVGGRSAANLLTRPQCRQSSTQQADTERRATPLGTHSLERALLSSTGGRFRRRVGESSPRQRQSDPGIEVTWMTTPSPVAWKVQRAVEFAQRRTGSDSKRRVPLLIVRATANLRLEPTSPPRATCTMMSHARRDDRDTSAPAAHPLRRWKRQAAHQPALWRRSVYGARPDACVRGLPRVAEARGRS